jgi:hypothetical protein
MVNWEKVTAAVGRLTHLKDSSLRSLCGVLREHVRTLDEVLSLEDADMLFTQALLKARLLEFIVGGRFQEYIIPRRTLFHPGHRCRLASH